MRRSFVELVEITSQHTQVSRSSLLLKFMALRKWILDRSCLIGMSVMGIQVVVSVQNIKKTKKYIMCVRPYLFA